MHEVAALQPAARGKEPRAARPQRWAVCRNEPADGAWRLSDFAVRQECCKVVGHPINFRGAEIGFATTGPIAIIQMERGPALAAILRRPLRAGHFIHQGDFLAPRVHIVPFRGCASCPGESFCCPMAQAIRRRVSGARMSGECSALSI